MATDVPICSRIGLDVLRDGGNAADGLQPQDAAADALVLSQGVVPNLHLAAALGREAMVKTLVAHGASPDLLAADGQTPLGVALASGRRDIADWLDWRGWPLLILCLLLFAWALLANRMAKTL